MDIDIQGQGQGKGKAKIAHCKREPRLLFVVVVDFPEMLQSPEAMIRTAATRPRFVHVTPYNYNDPMDNTHSMYKCTPPPLNITFHQNTRAVLLRECCLTAIA